MKKIELKTEIFQYSDILQLPLDEQELVYASRKACHNAYAPYSNFKVGAAVLLDNGEIITGTNQENAAYPSGLCAERTAIFWANSKYPDSAVLKISISALNHGSLIATPAAPCGACRQVLIETESRFNTGIKTIMDGSDKILVVEKTEYLLPLHFTSKNLEK
ncbi:cytidine deaminase [Plebeiibacterium marinum]|uniref:Cytidine deaminase n=1 Tax=Plebeiibacterium marinum TaxID=2992111 RepID=A0AAE3MI73_9BACT|nr:cytidine deaminase [Plebeiobacterium marinum]MCW3807557.1 cytidine deaminase [Plebeiobacterium marinum]